MVKGGGAKGRLITDVRQKKNSVLTEEWLRKQASGVIYCD